MENQEEVIDTLKMAIRQLEGQLKFKICAPEETVYDFIWHDGSTVHLQRNHCKDKCLFTTDIFSQLKWIRFDNKVDYNMANAKDSKTCCSIINHFLNNGYKVTKWVSEYYHGNDILISFVKERCY